MTTRKRTTEADRRRIVAEYRAWDRTAENAEQLAKRLGVSKQTLYSTVRAAGEPLHTRTGVDIRADRRTMALIADELAEVLIARLERQAVELERLGALYEDLYEAAVTAERSGDMSGVARHLDRAGR